MPAVAVEMTPQEFPIVGVAGGTFQPRDVVTLSGPHGTLRGEVREVKTRNYGNPPAPGLALMIAITAGNLAPFRNGGFAGYAVQTAGGVQGTVRTPCALKYVAQLMDEHELQKMVETAESLITRAATIKSDATAKKWFGTLATTPAELARIHQRCAQLRDGLAGCTQIVFQCAASETLGAISTTDPLRGGPSCRIQLGRGFTYDRYSHGERVCTIVHEMTHWYLDTVDATMDGADCYAAACIRLARSATEHEKALNNADNWAYYICEYRNTGDAGSWRYFTEHEITARGPFVSGAYNVDPLLCSGVRAGVKARAQQFGQRMAA